MRKSSILITFVLLLICRQFSWSQEYSPGRSTKFELGISAGTPAGIQPVLGIHLLNQFRTRVSFGKISTAKGFQVNLVYAIKDGRKLTWDISIAGGRTKIHDSGADLNWKYVGIFSSLNFHGIYLEPGLTWGKGDATNPQALFQIGYVYRFRK